MQLQARLVHADGQGRIVLVTAREGERVLGSALGEAAGAEEAEDRALARLMGRLEAAGPARISPGEEQERQGRAPAPVRRLAAEQKADGPLETPIPTRSGAPPGDQVPGEAPTTLDALATPEAPEDWSGELAQLDLEIQRLGWSRDQEAIYLQRAFGHPSRSRLTSYSDLLAYLGAVQGFAAGVDPAGATVPLRRAELLAQCDQLLERLGWDFELGRGFLERHLGVSSRQRLSDTQLLQFNMLLEGELIEGAGSTPAEGC